ncbi:MAG TPA: SDR family NAD(P)-dependent oxidoreductase [Candidatus Binatia bacterium]|nr:SDR family NAD(P)-dependent oxidoreductase [Candidatus Binatia bacterium]
MNEFQGRVAVVTGAASGIGRALAERLAGVGMNLVLSDVEEPALATAARELEAGGARVAAVPTDVSKPEQVDALAERAYGAFGAVHVLCNNAGVSSGGLTWQVPLGDWEWVLGVNLWGVIHGVRAFVPRMLEGGQEGHVVNTASMAGLATAPGMAPYHVSKFGVVAISESLHYELAMLGAKVKVSVLCPGWVNTRIADADRNRPADLPPPALAPDQEALRELVRGLLASGLAPSQVADRVLEAVREERFYILTHPDFTPMVRQRMHAILEQRNPAFTGLAR